MSSQRGNVKKSKAPKYQNKTAFKNSMHDTSKKTKALNNMCMTGVCKKCQDVIEWKIKYKKYKPLTQPKKCTKCQQKTVKLSYTIICAACREAEDVCAKCGVSLALPDEEGQNESVTEPVPEGASALFEVSPSNRELPAAGPKGPTMEIEEQTCLSDDLGEGRDSDDEEEEESNSASDEKAERPAACANPDFDRVSSSNNS